MWEFPVVIENVNVGSYVNPQHVQKWNNNYKLTKVIDLK